jgi:translation initiation factor IF-2
MTTENQQSQNLQTRPPVVVVLGHVDHGKSSIIEAIKDLKITEKESGGITQHIGAYEIEHQGKKITMIDTPGHEAFSAMRSRGAQTADIAVLVVAAEEGIKPQTKEAISFAKSAGIPIIVALNKMDLPHADPERVKTELSKEDIIVESRGGKIPSVEVSAKTGKGITDILEIILLISEMENFQADASAFGEGVVVEANLDSKRGPTATLLLRDGSLKQGDIVGTGTSMGKIKILQDFQGKTIDKAEPSQPVIIIGFEQVPQIGEKFKIHPDIEAAKQYIEKKERKANGPQVIIKNESQKVLNLILKADVSGTLEAIEKVLKALPQDKVIVRILKKEVGEINENDVKLAQSSNAKILGFRQKANSVALALADNRGVKIKTYDIIYELSQAVREMMGKALSTEIIRDEMGKLKVLLVFLSEKNRQIIGGKIIEGKIEKGGKIEVWRSEEKIGKGKMINLQKNKKDIVKASKGDEVGILYEGSVKIGQDDELVIYTEKMVKETL